MITSQKLDHALGLKSFDQYNCHLGVKQYAFLTVQYILGFRPTVLVSFLVQYILFKIVPEIFTRPWFISNSPRLSQ